MCGEIRGAVLRKVSRAAMSRVLGVAGSGWHHELQWQERPLAGQRLAAPEAAVRPEPEVVVARTLPRLRQLATEHDLAAYDQAIPALDRIATAHIGRALADLGWRPGVGDRITAPALADRAGVVAPHRRLLGRMLEALGEDGVLRRSGEEWVVAVPLATDDPEEVARATAERHPVCATELALIARCGPYLADVLRGRRDPLQLLFPGGSFEATEPLYERTPYARAFNAALREAVAGIVETLPPGRTLRVLEIGAGTGGSTSALLPVLPPDRTRYVFTDLSRLFLDRAAAKFAGYPFVEYALLDAEKPFAAQGIPEHGFDLVLASNVLHATRDLARTLGNVLEALAPGGGLAPSRRQPGASLGGHHVRPHRGLVALPGRLAAAIAPAPAGARLGGPASPRGLRRGGGPPRRRARRAIDPDRTCAFGRGGGREGGAGPAALRRTRPRRPGSSSRTRRVSARP